MTWRLDGTLDKCWNIVNWTIRNKLLWNLNLNADISIQENAFENVVCEIVAICLGLNVLNFWFFPSSATFPYNLCALHSEWINE